MIAAASAATAQLFDSVVRTKNGWKNNREGAPPAHWLIARALRVLSAAKRSMKCALAFAHARLVLYF